VLPSRADFGRGTVESYVTTDPQGRPTAVGILLSRGVLDTDGAGSFQALVGLPAGAPALPFSHIEVDWNPDGHAPAGVYHHPHFDIHFFIPTREERAQIVAGDRARNFREPPAGAVPEDYVADVTAFVGMGVHWFDRRAPELTGGAFSHTLIHGFWDGRMIFQEPMVSKAFLETRPTVVVPIRQPAQYPTRGWFPTSYRIQYDAASDRYRIALEGLVER
jgi:hypothetical protein